jgi:hypothetical protein
MAKVNSKILFSFEQKNLKIDFVLVSIYHKIGPTQHSYHLFQYNNSLSYDASSPAFHVKNHARV